VSKDSGNEFGLVVLMLDLCLSFLSGLDLGLEGVQEVGTNRSSLRKWADVGGGDSGTG